MLTETLREFHRAYPFEPFFVQMSDGRRFDVPHPDFAAVSPKGWEVIVFRENGAAVHLNSRLIASIEKSHPTAGAV